MNLTDARYRQLLIAVLILGAGLRLTGLGWDEGRGLHPDEGNLVRAAAQLSFPGRLIPSFHAYNDLALWLPRLLAWPFCAAGDGACLTWAARLVSALFSLATIPLAAALARSLAGPVAGLAAALAFAASAPLIQWAHFGTTESALAFLVVALWWVAVQRIAGQIGDGQMALWTGVLLGAGFGLKTTALVLAIMPLVALLLLGWPDRARIKAVAGGAGLALGLALATSPSVLAATADWLTVMRFENGVVTGTVPVFWTEQFLGASDGWYELRQLWSATVGAGVLLAVTGLILLPRVARRQVLPALIFALVYAVIAFGWQAKFFRYLAPLIPIVLVLAAVAVGRAVTLLKSQTAAALALAGLALMALAGLDQAVIYLKPDPRMLAEAALRARGLPQDVVAIEPNDLGQIAGRAPALVPLTTPDAGLDAIADPMSRAHWFLIASRRNWAVLPEKSASAPHACAFYAALSKGELGYHLAARFRRDGPFGTLFAPGLEAEETRAVFDRPEVLLFRNEARLTREELVTRLAAQGPDGCAPEVLAGLWGRPQ